MAPIGDREARIQQSTSVVAAVVLALLGVCVLLFSVASVLVRLRPRSGEEDAEVRGQRGQVRESPSAERDVSHHGGGVRSV